MDILALQEMSSEELKQTNGGNVPMAFYMDSDAIGANWNIIRGYIDGFLAAF
ncbi:MAG: hypothetical protein ACK5HZ_06045 [Macellibacteroides fermentans]|uniref:hypothetical protein n=1 Tax=Macellibacteroides fermentans TaxID=879969 RepID=UPI003AC8C9D4